MGKFFEFFAEPFSLSPLLLFIATHVSLTPRFKYDDLIFKFPRFCFAVRITR